MNRPTSDEDVLHHLVFQFTMYTMTPKSEHGRREELKGKVKSLWREFGIRNGWVENEYERGVEDGLSRARSKPGNGDMGG